MASGRYVTSLMVTGLTLLCSGISLAQSSADEAALDTSPTLLIETGPSDNPDYRRMVFVKYLNADAVTVAYVAYNRTEFIQVPDDTPAALISACQNGPASTLEHIHTYRDRDAEARDVGEPAVIEHFCIKNVSDWEAGNKAIYLDPIFEGLPHAAALNN